MSRLRQTRKNRYKKKTRGYLFKKPFAKRTKSQRKDYLEKNVFSNPSFDEHLTKVSLLIDVDKKVVRHVVTYFIIKVFSIFDKTSDKIRYVFLSSYWKFQLIPGNRY